MWWIGRPLDFRVVTLIGHQSCSPRQEMSMALGFSLSSAIALLLLMYRRLMGADFALIMATAQTGLRHEPGQIVAVRDPISDQGLIGKLQPLHVLGILVAE